MNVKCGATPLKATTTPSNPDLYKADLAKSLAQGLEIQKRDNPGFVFGNKGTTMAFEECTLVAGRCVVRCMMLGFR